MIITGIGGEFIQALGASRLYSLAIAMVVGCACLCTHPVEVRGQDALAEPIVHLRTYYNEPYLRRASLRDPEDRPFNSVWVTAKFQPTAADGGNPARQAWGIRKQMNFAQETMGVEVHGGYVLHPTVWLSPTHWQRRADALERIIIDAELTGSIALDIEAYGNEGEIVRPPSPQNRELQKLLAEACRPVAEVLKRHNLSATIYPAGGRGLGDYTAAAISLGATKLGDEYSFVFSQKIFDGKRLPANEWQFWRKYFSSEDPMHAGLPTIPGLLASSLHDRQAITSLSKLDIREAWLYVDDKNWLLRHAPRVGSRD